MKALNSERIWNDFNKPLKKFIVSRINNNDAADDILQEVFIRIHLNISKLKDESKLEPWVYQITRNIINDHYRKIKETIPVEKAKIPAVLAEHNNNENFLNCMVSMIRLLPSVYREAVELTGLKGLSQTHLAEQLKISYSGAKSRVQRGKKLLRSYIEDCCDVKADKYGNIIAHKARHCCTTCG